MANMTYKVPIKSEDYLGYDLPRAKKLVGTYVDEYNGKCYIQDITHHHFLLIRDDGWMHFVAIKDILKRIDERAEKARVKTLDPGKAIFQGKALIQKINKEGYGWYLLIGGYAGEGFGEGLAFQMGTAYIEIPSLQHYINPNITFKRPFKLGFGCVINEHYNYCHTVEADPTSPNGFKVVDSGKAYDFNEYEYIDFKDIPGVAIPKVMERLEMLLVEKEYNYSTGGGFLILWNEDYMLRFYPGGLQCFLRTDYKPNYYDNGDRGRYREGEKKPKAFSVVDKEKALELVRGVVELAFERIKNYDPEEKKKKYFKDIEDIKASTHRKQETV